MRDLFKVSFAPLAMLISQPDLLAVANPGTVPAPASTKTFPLSDLSADGKSRLGADTAPAQLKVSQLKEQSLPYRHLKNDEASQHTPDMMRISSSSEFTTDPDTLTIMEDITMVDTPKPPPAKSVRAPATVQEKMKSSDDEDFITPPTSPSITETSNESLIDPQLRDEMKDDKFRLYLQQSELIQLHKFTRSRKRPLPEPFKPALPRKASRAENTMRSTTVYNVNSLRPTVPSLEDPFRTHSDIGLMRSSTSFDSVSTDTTATTASSFAWSATRSHGSGSTHTTPNTSFRSDSLRTSFSSNHGNFYHAEIPPQVATSSVIPETKSTIRSAPNTPRAKRSNATLQRSATTSNAEAQAENTDPMEIDQSRLDTKGGIFSDLLGNPIADKDVVADGFLSNRLRSLTLLRMLTYRAAKSLLNIRRTN